MVVRARLSPPPAAPREEWPYHKLEWTSLHARFLMGADRRMEAENYLSHGYRTRVALEACSSGWVKFAEVANIWQPSRLKGIQVSREFGTPFLAATQVFDIRPVPRKWLALERTEDAKNRFVQQGTILVTCSGSVGRATLAFTPHLDTLITHDLLRVEPRDEKWRGWLYACMRAPKMRAVMTSSRYGHIIKHLEVSHLNSLPIPLQQEKVLADFNRRVNEIIDLRDQSYGCSLKAEDYFEKCLGPLSVPDQGEEGFVIGSALFFSKRRRMDAMANNPIVRAIYDQLEKRGKGFSKLEEVGFRAWLPTRFRRIPAADGVELVDISDLFEINPDIGKRIADGNFGDPNRGRVEPGWLLLARSGQIYGLNGSLVLSTTALANKIITDDVIRIAPLDEAQIRTGYLLVALSHPRLGQPVIKSLAYGSSVPHIEPNDFANLNIVRLSQRDEDYIAELAEKSADHRARADILETQLAGDAEEILNQFIAG